ncbi:MAG: hypothetical protein HOO86_06200 [Bacteroidales bacterium]|nr:hypothetical protein [Bacteroidales bacterium]
MKKVLSIIDPLKGYGSLKFGQTIQEVVALLGDAEEIDEIDEDDMMNTVILHYWELGISVFFEGIEKSVVSCIETDNMDAELFGVKVFDIGKEEAIELMKANGFTDYELELEEGENRLSFEEGLIDFFYADDELIAVSWGVLINENGEIEQI